MEGKHFRRRDCAREKESRPQTISDFRLLRAQRMASPEGGGAVAGQCRTGLPRSASRWRGAEEGNPRAGKGGPLIQIIWGAHAPRVLVTAPRRRQCTGARRSLRELPPAPALCKIGAIPDQVS